jgi:hypothetical protein
MTGRPDSRLGTELGPYRIEAVIGRGGMGVVYLATHGRLGRKVALKIVAPEYSDDARLRARFIRESQMAAAIDHPNILPIYEADEADGVLFIAMRLVEGADLASRLGAGPLEPRQAIQVLAQVAAALDAAHTRGLIHRDVKPANVLIAPGSSADGGDHVYLTDFGLTKRGGSESSLTAVGAFAGTLAYIAPEQVEGREVDGRADQYSLACVAFECLTGQVPFERESDIAVAMAQLRDAPPSAQELRPELPSRVDAVLARGMAKAPDDRYASCVAFVADLRGALDISATAPQPIPVAGSRRSRRMPLAIRAGALLIIVAAGVLLGVGAFGPGATPSPSPTEAAGAPNSPGASPTEDVYPNAAEAALLGVLPSDLAEACTRGPYNSVEFGSSGGFSQPTGKPLASLFCPLDITTGANEVVIRRFAPGHGGGGAIDEAVSFVEDRRGLKPGDCATSPQAGGRWEVGGADVGAIACYRDTTTGDATLYWSYKDRAILVRATNQRGDSAALYDWFTQNARFIAP